MSRRLIALLAVPWVASCYSPSFVECQVACGVGDDCPSGTSCGGDGFCHGRGNEDVICPGPPPGDAGSDGGGPVPDGPLPVDCPTPMLLVSIESFDNAGGHVARFSLAGGDFTRCSDLTGQGTLDDQPLALAFVAPDRVAVAGRDKLDLIDANSDAVIWTSPFLATQVPLDALLVGEGPMSRIAVGLFNPQTTNDLDPVELFDLADGQPAGNLDTGISTRSVARDPRNPSLMLRLRPDMFSAAELDPFTGDQLDNPPYVAARSDSLLRTVQASFSRPPRIAWTGVRLNDNREGVYYLNDPDKGDNDQLPLGPIRCDDLDRTYLRAIPDPTLNTRFFAVSELDGSRQVVRFKSTGGACDVVLDGDELGPSRRIADLVAVE